MSAQLYSVPGQTGQRRKAFLERTSKYFSSKPSLTYRDNVNYYKSIHHPIPTLSVGIGNTLRNNFQNKWISLYIHSKWINQEEYIPGHSIERIQLSVQVYTLLDQTEEEGKTFLGGARSWAALWDYPQEHLVFIRGEKVCPLVKFEIIIPLLCGLLNAVTNKHCRAWSSMINLWIDSRTCQKKSRILLSGAQRSNN